MSSDSEIPPEKQVFTLRQYQIDMAAALDSAIWTQEGPALGVAPVSAGKTVILCIVAVMAVDRGEDVVVVSRSTLIAEQSLRILALPWPNIPAGLYTGRKKDKDARILFATAPALARHLDVVEQAGLVLIDEADQAYLRDETKEYTAILKTARRYAGVTGTPFVLVKGRTVPIFRRAA